MSELRGELVRWASAGAFPHDRMREALRATDAAPTRAAWRAFLDRLLLWLAIVALAAALAFFIAANWQALGRFGKIALCEAAIVALLGVCWWRGIDSLWGRASLVAASLAVGTLLALVGQTYQTGADTYELFVVWAVAIAAWVVVAQLPALWILWIGIVDVAVTLYLGVQPRWFGALFSLHQALWLLLAIHVLALAIWEAAIRRGVQWLDVRWAPRLLAVLAGVAATVLVIESVAFGPDDRVPGWGPGLAYVALMVGLYVAYRVWRVDLFILAAAVLSVIVVATALMIRAGAPGGFLVIGLVIVALAAAGASWLRGIAKGTAS